MRTISKAIARLTPTPIINQLFSSFKQASAQAALRVTNAPMKRGAIVAILVTPLLGCSMHPLPEDVSRKNTYDIVKKIRCEAAEELRAYAANDPIVANTFIGYDFDFDITENNNLGTNGARGIVSLEQKLLSPSASFKLDVKPFVEASRETHRTFRIIESLKVLKRLDEQQCSPTQANWAFPITGAIGINEVVETYIGLEKLTDFAKESAPTTLPVPGPAAPPPAPPTPPPAPKENSVVFSDLLTFTTNFGASVTPDLTLNSAVGTLKLTRASIVAEATRKDIHKVTVALARDLTIPVDGAVLRRSARINTGDMEYLKSTNRINARVSRNADAVARKLLTGSSQVLVELERRRSLVEDETTVERLVEILRPTP